METIERPYTANEVADLLSMSPATVKRKARTDQWPARKVGRSWLFTQQDVAQILGTRKGKS